MILSERFQDTATSTGGRKARGDDALINYLGRGEVYPRSHGTGHRSNLRNGIAHFGLSKISKGDFLNEYK
jgi:hypothetical protein